MIYNLHQGTSPLLVSVPHCGTHIPQELQANYTKQALRVEDTDWYLHELYDFVKEKGASFLTSQVSRYVIDNNRPPENQVMYKGANNTELCPTRSFEGVGIYITPPTPLEIERRKVAYWQQYHDALKTELARIKGIYGYALLWDGHSIKSHLPWLFEGKLPDLNLGTASGASCSDELLHELTKVIANSNFTHAVNGRFRGGYITRNYGQPANNIHAVQLEMCFSTYMQEREPYMRDEARIAKLTPVLEKLIDKMLGWKP